MDLGRLTIDLSIRRMTLSVGDTDSVVCPKYITYFSEARIILDIIGSHGNSAMRRPSLVNSPMWFRAPKA